MGTARAALGATIAATILLVGCDHDDADATDQPTTDRTGADRASGRPGPGPSGAGAIDSPTIGTVKSIEVGDMCRLITLPDMHAAGLTEMARPAFPMGRQGCGAQAGPTIVLFGFTGLRDRERLPRHGQPYRIDGNTAVTLAAPREGRAVTYVVVDPDTLLGVIVTAPEPIHRLAATSRALTKVAFARLPSAWPWLGWDS